MVVKKKQHKHKGGSIMREQVTVMWMDPSTEKRYQSQVDFNVRLDFDKMKDVIISF